MHHKSSTDRTDREEAVVMSVRRCCKYALCACFCPFRQHCIASPVSSRANSRQMPWHRKQTYRSQTGRQLVTFIRFFNCIAYEFLSHTGLQLVTSITSYMCVRYELVSYTQTYNSSIVSYYLTASHKNLCLTHRLTTRR